MTRWLFYLCMTFVLIISHHSELLSPALMQLFLPKYPLPQNKRSKLKKLRRHRQLMKFTRPGKLREVQNSHSVFYSSKRRNNCWVEKTPEEVPTSWTENCRTEPSWVVIMLGWTFQRYCYFFNNTYSYK